MKKHQGKKIAFLFGVLVIAVWFGIYKSSVYIPVKELFQEGNRQILMLRLARVSLAIFVGAGLSVCGVALQAILRNPLADPYLLGTSSGAGLGAVIAVSLGLSYSFLPFVAFIGAILSIIIVYGLAQQNARVPVQSLILSGVIVAITLSGFTIFLVSLSSSQALHGMMWWLLGSLQIYNFKLLTIVGVITGLGIAFISAFAQDLNAISIGEEEAVHLGIATETVKKILFLATALITGALVSVSGMIGFVGLIVPHMMRLVVGPNHKILIPASCLAGAAFLVFCDTLSRSVMAPVEISIGVVTSLIGAPIFIILLKRGQNSR